MKSFAASLLPLLLVAGCAKYEYDITQPAEFATHIGRKTDAVTKREPLVYRWRTVDNRLVVRIFNPTADPITLLGERSTVVAPGGQSHPLRGQTIAPQSHAKLILPPPRPRVYGGGPTFGVGVGMHTHGTHRHYPHYPFHDPYWDEPRYMTVYDDDAIYWDWRGESEARLTLVYQRGEESFRHEFTIRRKKV